MLASVEQALFPLGFAFFAIALLLVTYIWWFPLYKVSKLDSGQHPWHQLLVLFWPPVAIFVFFLVMYLIFAVPNQSIATKLVKFAEGWQLEVTAVLLGCYIAAMIIFIPNQLERQIKHLFEAFQTPLGNFSIVHRIALTMLKSTDGSPQSKFIMIAGTPVFGVELDDRTRADWVNALSARAANGAPTSILCWDWDHPEGARKSPLGRLCVALSRHSVGIGPPEKKAGALLVRAWEYYGRFSAFTPDANFSLKVIDEPPFGMVLTEDERGQKKLLIFFGSPDSISEGFRPVGFITQQDLWLRLAEHTFERLLVGAKSVVDRRDDRQKARDAELMDIYRCNYDQREVTVEKITLNVHPDVFPPDSGTSTQSMVRGIRSFHKLLSPHYDKSEVGSVDFGCGCGILAFALAEHSSLVIGIDTNKAAVINAIENVKGYTGGSQIQFALGARISDALPFVATSAVIVVAANFPFYKSPFNIYNWGSTEGGADIVARLFNDIKRLPQGPQIVALLPEASFTSGFSVERLAIDAEVPFKTITVKMNASGTEKIIVAGKLVSKLWPEP